LVAEVLEALGRDLATELDEPLEGAGDDFTSSFEYKSHCVPLQW